MTVQPGSARWKELVQQGIMKDGQRNWFLGDAALEIAPMGPTGPMNGSHANLQRYAEDIGIEFRSLLEYRRVSAAWPVNTRVFTASWKVHSQLTNRPELIRPGMTVTQAANVLGQSNVGRTGPTADVESRASAVLAYLSDQDVADKLMESPEARRTVVQAQTRRENRQQELQRNVKPDGLPPLIPPYDVLVDMNEDLHEIRYRLRTIHERQARLRASDRESVAASLDVIASQASLIASVVRNPESARVTDDALQDLLDGGR